ncbi:MAG: hypothetical protein JW913_13435 [Chitinispirillaceae bacterium]|nr:hypothetical protein [Chitinispirillaceae bacterium]
MAKKGYSFGTFQGGFVPSILTILGVIMYLRFGWVLGATGIVSTLLRAYGFWPPLFPTPSSWATRPRSSLPTAISM